MKLYYLLAIVVLWQIPKPFKVVVEDDPFCHVAQTNGSIQETQRWTDHGKLPPGHWTHFQAATWCPPDYSGMCDGRYECVKENK